MSTSKPKSGGAGTALKTQRERRDFQVRLREDLSNPHSNTWKGLQAFQAERKLEQQKPFIEETVEAARQYNDLTRKIHAGGGPIEPADLKLHAKLARRFEGLTTYGPTRAEVHIDTALSTLMATFGQGQFIGDALCPPVSVTKRSGKIFKRRIQDVQRGDEFVLRSPDAEAAEIEWGMGTQISYEVQDYKAKKTLPDYIAQDADAPINVDEITAQDVAAVLAMNREIRIATLLTTTGNYDSGNVVTAPSVKWDNATTSDNEHWTDIQAMHHLVSDNTGMPPTDCFMTKKMALALISKDHFRESLIYVDGALPMFLLGKIAEYCMVDRAHIAFGRKTTSNPGQATQTRADIWPDTFGMLTVGSPSTHYLGFALSPATAALVMSRYRHPLADRESEVIWGKEVRDEIVVNNLMGAVNTDTLTA